MSPFEFLYRCKFNTPISCCGHIDGLMLGHDLLEYMELTMKQVQQNLKDSQYRH